MDHFLNRDKVGDGFVAKAWIEMVRLFNGKFGLTVSKIHLRWQCNDTKVLLEQRGLS